MRDVQHLFVIQTERRAWSTTDRPPPRNSRGRCQALAIGVGWHGRRPKGTVCGVKDGQRLTSTALGSGEDAGTLRRCRGRLFSLDAEGRRR